MKRYLTFVLVRCIIIVSVLLSFFLSGLQAQSTNPFELYNSQDTIIDTGQDTSEILQNVASDTVSQIVTPPMVPTKPTELAEANSQDTVVAVLPNENKEGLPLNPFELRKGVSEPIAEIKPMAVDSALDVPTIANPNELVNLEVALDSATEQVAVPIEKPSIEAKAPKRNGMQVFIFCLFSCLLLAILLTGNSSILSEIQKSLNNSNYMKLFQKEERNGRSISFVLLYMIYIINMGIFARFCLMHYDIPAFSYNIWIILIVITGLVLLRHTSLAVLSFLRKKLPDAASYSFIIAMVNALIGLVLIPINLLIAYGPEGFSKNLILVGLGTILLAFLLKWLKGFLNSLRIILGDSFHFLLYLCTCEIVPILICIGFLRNLIN